MGTGATLGRGETPRVGGELATAGNGGAAHGVVEQNIKKQSKVDREIYLQTYIIIEKIILNTEEKDIGVHYSENFSRSFVRLLLSNK